MKVLCFIIHGIGSQDPDFAKPLKEGVHKQLVKLLHRKKDKSISEGKPLSPADVVEFRELYWANIGSAEQDELYRRLYPEYYADSMIGKIKSTLKELSPLRSLSFRLIGDIVGYLGKFQEQIKKTVFESFVQQLEEKARQKEQFSIIVVSHSLGSVIVHDILSGLVESHSAGLHGLPKSTSVFTMGSPLALFSLTATTLAPNVFRRWTNLLDVRDPIAFPLATLFKGVRDVRLRRWRWNTHAFYWNDTKVHQRVAEEVLEHYNSPIPVNSDALHLPKEAPPELLRPFHGSALTAGFYDFKTDFTEIPFKDLIESSEEIDICNLYGRTWYANNAQYFKNAFAKPFTKIRAFMLSPENPGLPGYCYQFEQMDPDTLRTKIEDATGELIRAFQAAKEDHGSVGQLKIYRLNNIISHSFYRFDRQLFYVPQKISSPKHTATPIPVLVFRLTESEKQFGGWLMRDINAVADTPKDCMLYFDSEKTELQS